MTHPWSQVPVIAVRKTTGQENQVPVTVRIGRNRVSILSVSFLGIKTGTWKLPKTTYQLQISYIDCLLFFPASGPSVDIS